MIQILITTILILIRILQHNTIHILNICAAVCPFGNNPEILNIKREPQRPQPHPSILWCLNSTGGGGPLSSGRQLHPTNCWAEAPWGGEGGGGARRGGSGRSARGASGGGAHLAESGAHGMNSLMKVAKPPQPRGSPNKGTKSEVKTYARGNNDAPSISPSMGLWYGQTPK